MSVKQKSNYSPFIVMFIKLTLIYYCVFQLNAIKRDFEINYVKLYCDLSDIQIITLNKLNVNPMLCISSDMSVNKRLLFSNNKHYGKLKLLFLIIICGDINLNPGSESNLIFERECNVVKNLKGLKIIHFNAQSIVRKIDEFRHICSEINPDFLCISETWFNSNHSDYEFRIDGYELFRKD